MGFTAGMKASKPHEIRARMVHEGSLDGSGRGLCLEISAGGKPVTSIWTMNGQPYRHSLPHVLLLPRRPVLPTSPTRHTHPHSSHPSTSSYFTHSSHPSPLVTPIAWSSQARLTVNFDRYGTGFD
jgi:hypothetical protein